MNTAEKSIVSDVALIQQQIKMFVKAFRTKDVDLMMSLFSSEMISFDIIPPLQYVGSNVYRKVWVETFELFQDPIDLEISNLNVTSDKNIAFSYCFLHLHATMTSGHETNFWERLTFCFKKIGNKWLIAHEHVSLPADLKNGKAVMDLKP